MPCCSFVSLRKLFMGSEQLVQPNCFHVQASGTQNWMIVDDVYNRKQNVCAKKSIAVEPSERTSEAFCSARVWLFQEMLCLFWLQWKSDFLWNESCLPTVICPHCDTLVRVQSNLKTSTLHFIAQGCFLQASCSVVSCNFFAWRREGGSESERARDGERQRDRDRESEKQRETHTERQRGRERQRETYREKERENKGEGKRKIYSTDNLPSFLENFSFEIYFKFKKHWRLLQMHKLNTLSHTCRGQFLEWFASVHSPTRKSFKTFATGGTGISAQLFVTNPQLLHL